MSRAPAFDILRIEPDGAVIRYESAATLQAAKSRVRALGALEPRAYIIRNQLTHAQLIVPPPLRAKSSAKKFRAAGPSGKESQAAVGLSLRAYHICKIEKDRLRCVESADSLDAAAARIRILSSLAPGDYLVLDYNPELPSRTPATSLAP